MTLAYDAGKRQSMFRGDRKTHVYGDECALNLIISNFHRVREQGSTHFTNLLNLESKSEEPSDCNMLCRLVVQ